MSCQERVRLPPPGCASGAALRITHWYVRCRRGARSIRDRSHIYVASCHAIPTFVTGFSCLLLGPGILVGERGSRVAAARLVVAAMQRLRLLASAVVFSSADAKVALRRAARARPLETPYST